MKKVVHFVRNPDDYILVGKSAHIRTTVDHPGELDFRLQNMRFSLDYSIDTSAVTEVDEYGFETKNTIYIAVSLEEAKILNWKFWEQHRVS